MSVPACGREDAPRLPETSLRIGTALPRQGTPNLGVSGMVSLLTTEAMVTNEPDGRQSGRLASSWTWNTDHTVLRMKLRRDVLFHGGTPLTAELAAQALRASIQKHEAFSFGSVTSVAATGEDAIEFHLSVPDSFLLPDLSLMTLKLPGHPDLGTGPFQLTRDRGADATRPITVLRAFDRYYRGRPSIDRIEIVPFQSQRQAWAAMMRGGVDVLHEVSRDAIEFVEAETTVNTYSFPRSYYIPLVFNVNRPVLQRAEVRRAINEGIDKNALVNDGLQGRGRPADGPIWPEHWAYSSSRMFAFNPDAARLRLDSAGFPVRQQANGMPARFSFSCVVLDDVRFSRLALVLQKQLWDIGIDMRLVPVTATEFAKRMKTGDFDAFLFEMAGRSLSWVYAFWHSPPEGLYIDTGYTAADAVLDRIRHARSDEDVRAGVSDLSRIFYEDPPAAFLAWQSQSRAVSKKFEVVSDANRDVMSTVWQWHPAPESLKASR